MRSFRPHCARVGHFRLRQAARWIKAGGIVAYPTEGVYGLGCHPRLEAAVLRLLAIKKRDINKGLILIAADFDQLREYVVPLDEEAMRPVLASWPGPFTWLLPARPSAPGWVRGNHETIAVRVTAHPTASALCRAAGTALVSTSANLSGRAPSRSAVEVRKQLGTEVDFLLSGPLGTLHRPTPILDGRTGAFVRV